MPNNNLNFRLTPLLIALSEDAKTSPPERIQVIRVGTFHHAEYGKFEVTKEHLLSFKKNFDARIRNIDIALDYGHNSGGEAAAWFKELILSDDGTELWAVPEWTPEGGAAVIGKKYRYVSADFNFDYQDNETLKKHGPTLLGAGLTNRPVVKGQAPVIELTEGKGDAMDPKDKMIEELKAKIAELEAKLSGGGEAEMSAMKNDLMKKDEVVAGLTKELACIKGEKVAAEKKSAFDKKMSEGAVVEAQRESFMSGDMTKFMELAQPMKLADVGSGAPPPAAGAKDVEDEVIELAQKAVSDKRAANVVEGISMVLSENQALRQRYEAKQV